jgi:hypothetical protein
MPIASTNRKACVAARVSSVPHEIMFSLDGQTSPVGDPGINRPSARSDDQQKNRPQQHREVCARFVSHAPEAVVWKSAQTEAPEAVPQYDGNLSGQDRHQHIDDQRDCCQPREQSEQDERAADNFNNSDERSHGLRRRDADLGETPDTVFSGKEELLNPLGEEDCAHDKPNEGHRSRRACSDEPLLKRHTDVLFALCLWRRRGKLCNVSQAKSPLDLADLFNGRFKAVIPELLVLHILFWIGVIDLLRVYVLLSRATPGTASFRRRCGKDAHRSVHAR